MKQNARQVNRRRQSSFEALDARQYLAARIAGSPTAYATIQAAVNAAAPGATINVDAGTYAESIVINKTLTLRGAQAGVDGRGTRSAESIISISPTAVRITASDVVFDGFTVQGTKANIGAALGAGVIMAPGVHGTQLLNNIIKNNVTGVYLANNSDTDAALIQRNYFYNNTETGSDWTYGWNGSRAIYSDGEVSGGLLTNVLIDSNKFYRDDSYTGEGMIALAAQGANKQFNVTISRNVFASPNRTSSKAILVFNTTNLAFIGNDVSGQNDTSSGPVRFEGNADNVDISYNTIHDNDGPGIAVDSAGVVGDSSGFVVSNNNIYNNKQNNIGLIVKAADYLGTFFALNNWWGAASGPSGQGTGTGQAVWGDGNTGHYTNPTGKAGGDVRFSPWATSLISIANIPVPATPTSLTATPASATSVALSWIPSYTTATSQLIQRSTDGINFATIATISPLLAAFTNTGLTAGLAYAYRVIAANFTGNSSPSNAVSASPAPYQAPVAPTGLNVTSTSPSSVSLSWTAPANAYGIASYTIYRNGVAVGTSTTTTFTDFSLTPSTLYTYSVATVDTTGATSPRGGSINATTVAAQFRDNGFETTRTATYIYNPTTTNWTFANSSGLAANGSAFAAATAPEGTQVAFIQSNTKISKVSQTMPVGLTGSYTISFAAARRVGTGYGIQPIAVSVDGVVVGTITPSSGSFATYTTSAFNLTAGSHTFTFAGTNNSGDNTSFVDAVSLNLVTSATAPAAPLNVTASASSASQINLTWAAVAGAQSSFSLQRSTDGVNFVTIAGSIAGTALSYSDTGLTGGTTYYYRLYAINTYGTSPASAVANATTVSASSVTTPISSLNWTSATSGWNTPLKNLSVAGNPLKLRGTTYASGIGTHAASTIVYNVAGKYTNFLSDIGVDDEVNGKGTGSVDFQIIGDGRVLFDSGVLTNGSAIVSVNLDVTNVQTLTLIANSVNGDIDFAHADWANARLLSNPTAPATPAGLTATGLTTSSISVAWSAVAGATGYTLERSLDGVTWSTAVAGTTNVTYTDAGLAAGTSYRYRVRATNSVGASANSAVVTASTISASAVTTPLSSLTWVSATAGYGSVQKNLNASGDPLNINGTPYASGIGTHASSTIVYNLAGAYTTFQSDIGYDYRTSGKPSDPVYFQVIGDGKVLFDSGAMTNASPTLSISVDVSGVQSLTLIANAVVAGNIDYGHVDWGNARLLSPGASAAAFKTLSVSKPDATTTSTTSTSTTAAKTTTAKAKATVTPAVDSAAAKAHKAKLAKAAKLKAAKAEKAAEAKKAAAIKAAAAKKLAEAKKKAAKAKKAK